MAKRKNAADTKWTIDSVVKAIAAEVKKDEFGWAWEGIDAVVAESPAQALALATALLKLGFSDELPARQRPTRENILQAGREGWNPGNIKLFSHLERISRHLFGDRFDFYRAEELAPKTRLALARHTADWTDEMLWTFLRTFATNAGSLKKRKFVPKLLKEITPTQPDGPGAMFLNNLRGVKNAKRPAAKKVKAAPAAPAAKVVVAVPPVATLEALRARPDDKAALSVFSDWLAEVGDPTGELIQLELGLASRPKDGALLSAKQAWMKAHPAPSPCLTIERTLGLPRAATFEFKTGKADERKALVAFLSSPQAHLVDTVRLHCGRVQPFKPVVEALVAARPLPIKALEVLGDGVLDVPEGFLSSKTFPRLEQLELGPHKFARAPVIELPTLKVLTVGVSRHNGPLTLELAAVENLRTLRLATAVFDEAFLKDLLRGKWALTGLGLFAWNQPGLWERLQAAPIFASLSEVGASWEVRPPAPKGKKLMVDLYA